jgi:hypothetical protein
MDAGASFAPIPPFPTLPANATPNQSAQFLANVEQWVTIFDATKTGISAKGDAEASAANRLPQAT